MYHALCNFIYACSCLFFFRDCSQNERRIGGGRVRQVSVQVLRCIEKITELEENGFRLLEDQVFAMQLQKLPEDTPEDEVDEVWFYAALDKQYQQTGSFYRRLRMGRFRTRRTSWRQITAIRENCGSP